jgi:hypothetical protein
LPLGSSNRTRTTEIKYSIPKEGTILWFDMLTIPKDAPHSESAYAFINFAMNPEGIGEITNFYANANAVAQPLASVKNDPGIYPTPELLPKLTVQLADSDDQARAITRVPRRPLRDCRARPASRGTARRAASPVRRAGTGRPVRGLGYGRSATVCTLRTRAFVSDENCPSHHGLVGIPTTGGPPVTGKKRLPPTGMPMTGAPPVAGTIKRGPVLSSCGGKNVVTAAEAELASS